MDKKKINRIFGIALLVLGILNICAAVFRETLPHSLQMAVAICQIVTGVVVVYTSVLKIKGKF